jgi:hypothetical protein
MTQSVADKTPIPEKAWRRHSDPPALWFGVATISIILHLLLFWLLRSYSSRLLWQQSNSNPVPIEFVEISPQRRTSSKTKPVSPKRPSTTSKSSTLRTPKSATQENLTTKSASSQEDSNRITYGARDAMLPKETAQDAIASTNTKKARTPQPQREDISKPSSSSPIVEQKETQPSPQPFVTSQPTRQQSPIPESTTPFENEQQPIPESTTPFENENPEPTPELNTADNLDDIQNPANQKLGEQNQASAPTNSLPETTPSQPFNEPIETPAIPGQPGGRVSVGEGTPLEEIAPPVKLEPSPPLDEQNRGGLVASWDIEADQLKRDIPDNLAQPEGNSRQKELSLVLPDATNSSQPVDFLVWLTIDEKGNVIFIKVDENIPQTQRSQYQEYAEEIFQDQKFIAATDKDPTSGTLNPRMSHLPIRVRIKRP